MIRRPRHTSEQAPRERAPANLLPSRGRAAYPRGCMTTPPSPLRTEFRAMLVLAAPMALANMLQMAVYAIDVVFVGRLGQQALASASLAVTLFGLQVWCLSALTGALAPIISAELGRADAADGDEAAPPTQRAIRRTLRMALWLALGCAGLSVAVCGQGRVILLALGQSSDLAMRAGGFLMVLRWAMIPMLAGNVLRNFVGTMGRPVFATLITALAICVNAAGNYALVFGHWGAPALGLMGSALSSCITASITLAAYVLTIRATPAMRVLRLGSGWWRADWPRLRAILHIGLPMAITVVAEAGLFSGAAFLMGRLGEAQLAGHAVAMQVASFTFMLPFGISQAATIRVGYHYGAGDHQGIRRAGLMALAVGLGFACVSSGLMLFAPRLILSAYLDIHAARNAAVVAFAVSYLAVAAAFQLADAAQTIATGSLRGLQDTRRPMFIAIFGYWAVGMGTAIVLGFFTPLAGVGIWMGLASGLCVVAGLLLWRWHRRGALGLLPA